jgi:hypothetical protein
MKFFSTALCLAMALLALDLAGCKKAETDASGPLLRSFQNADAETKQDIQSVTGDLKASNYVAAVKTLLPLVERQKLSPDQKQALALTLKQINEATGADPAFDSKEMYEMRSELFHAVYKN